MKFCDDSKSSIYVVLRPLTSDTSANPGNRYAASALMAKLLSASDFTLGRRLTIRVKKGALVENCPLNPMSLLLSGSAP